MAAFTPSDARANVSAASMLGQSKGPRRKLWNSFAVILATLGWVLAWVLVAAAVVAPLAIVGYFVVTVMGDAV